MSRAFLTSRISRVVGIIICLCVASSVWAQGEKGKRSAKAGGNAPNVVQADSTQAPSASDRKPSDSGPAGGKAQEAGRKKNKADEKAADKKKGPKGPPQDAGKKRPPPAVKPGSAAISLVQAILIAEKLGKRQAVKAELRDKPDVHFKIELADEDGEKIKIELDTNGRPRDEKQRPGGPSDK